MSRAGELRDERTVPVLWVDNVVAREVLLPLGPHTVSVYVALLTYANRASVAWPSHAKLAARAHVSEREVRRAMDRLEGAGLLRTQPRHRDDGGRSSNLVTLTDSEHEPAPRGQVGQGGVASEARAPGHGGRVTNTNEPDTSKNDDTAIAVRHEAAADYSSASMRQRFTDTYRAAQGNQARMGALGELYRQLIGREPEYPRLAKLVKDMNSGHALGLLLFELAAAEVQDDPMDYLQAMVQRAVARKGEQRAPAAGGKARGLSAEELMDL